MAYAIEMLNITKDFPGIRANDDVTLQVEEGTIHALLGENGAGKSTLMSILFGLYQPTSGIIKVRGKMRLIPRQRTFPDSSFEADVFFGFSERTPGTVFWIQYSS